MAAPSFLLSKAERRKEIGADVCEIAHRYRDAFIARFVWDGLPEGCPADYIEDSLFWYGAVSGKRIKGLGAAVMAAAPSRFNLYGEPVRWLPAGITPADLGGDPLPDVFREDDGPVLWLGAAVEKIKPYLEIQRKAVNALNQNMAALAMPILLEVTPGAELNAKLIEQNLGSGAVYFQTIDRGSLGAEVLDMHAQDHSQSLISVIHDCDSTILDMLHIRAALEKSSGISEEESIASEEQLSQGMQLELRLRRNWCERINAALGLNLSVRICETEKKEEKDDEPGHGKDAETDH